MYCAQCGADNPDNRTVCQACGKPLVAANPFQSSVSDTGQPFGPVPNYLWQSIVVTLCCCLPFGIVAIVNAAQVDSKLAARNYSGAAKNSSSAKMWCWIAFGCGLVINAIVAAVQIAAYRLGRHGR